MSRCGFVLKGTLLSQFFIGQFCPNPVASNVSILLLLLILLIILLMLLLARLHIVKGAVFVLLAVRLSSSVVVVCRPL